MTVKTIHLVFKTHLDIGFTDLAAKVRRQYHERFIPQAIETGEHFYAEDPNQKMFVWTTGAWLIWDHLKTQPKDRVARLERAIARGLIRWHALPFTTHSELMSPALFRAGLSFARELDDRFGMTTTAAKMTDVPGHTRGVVPILAEAGMRFLHIGVNSSSTPPEVPEIFRWRAPGGDEVVVVYQPSYGSTLVPDGFSDGLSFAHTLDNIGPQSVSQVVECHRELRREHAHAEIRAASLDGFGAMLWSARNRFPVVDTEIGDSWIHGVAADPVKTARFLTLQRLYDRFVEEGLSEQRRAFGRGLTLVAEHTCGVDTKTYLRDEEHWSRRAFEAARKNDFRFAYAESSWAEQRAYLDDAVAELDPLDRVAADAALAELRPLEAATGEPDSNENGATTIEVGGWQIALDPSCGTVRRMVSPNGVTVDGGDAGLIAYSYESYDAADVRSHLETYLTTWPEWAILDHDKPGLDNARAAHSALWRPSASCRCLVEKMSALRLEMPREAHEQLGAPRQADMVFRPEAEGRLTIVLVLRDKPANRMPEASFLAVTPAGATEWSYLKMGLWQPADRVVPKGGGHLQAVAAVRATLPGSRTLTVFPRETPLVAPSMAPFMRFLPAPPDLSDGIRFNLHNNKWGTNFPMWWEGTFQARFTICID